MEFVFQIAVLIMSVVIHEVSHGYAAASLGDNTARYEGRLTLNPIRHLDFVGSILVPFLAYNLGGFLFGWAKPVPYNPYNLRPGRWSEAIVAGAGPLSNIFVAIVFSLFIRTGLFVELSSVIVLTNIVLTVFNLVPIPPLDGSKILFAVFPAKILAMRGFFEQYGFMLVVLFILFFWQAISPLIIWLFGLFTGFAI